MIYTFVLERGDTHTGTSYMIEPIWLAVGSNTVTLAICVILLADVMMPEECATLLLVLLCIALFPSRIQRAP